MWKARDWIVNGFKDLRETNALHILETFWYKGSKESLEDVLYYACDYYTRGCRKDVSKDAGIWSLFNGYSVNKTTIFWLKNRCLPR